MASQPWTRNHNSKATGPLEMTPKGKDLRKFIKKAAAANELLGQHFPNQAWSAPPQDLPSTSQNDLSDSLRGPEQASVRQLATASRDSPDTQGPSNTAISASNLKSALQEVVCGTIGISTSFADPSIDRLVNKLSAMMSAVVDEKICTLDLRARFEVKMDSVRSLTFQQLSDPWGSLEKVYEILASEVHTYQKLLDAIQKRAVDEKSRLAPAIKVFNGWEQIRPDDWERVQHQFNKFFFTVESTLTIFLAIPNNPPAWAARLATNGYVPMVFPESSTFSELKTEIYNMIVENEGEDFLPYNSESLAIIPSHKEERSSKKWHNHMRLGQCVHHLRKDLYAAVLSFCASLKYSYPDTWFGEGNGNVFNNSYEVLNKCTCSLVDPSCKSIQCRGVSASKKDMLRLSKDELMSEIIDMKNTMRDWKDRDYDSASTDDSVADLRSGHSCESGSGIDEEQPTQFHSPKTNKTKQNQKSTRQQVIHDDEEIISTSWGNVNANRKQPATTNKRTFVESVASSSDRNDPDGMSNRSSVTATEVQLKPETHSRESAMAIPRADTPRPSYQATADIRYDPEYIKRWGPPSLRSTSPSLRKALPPWRDPASYARLMTQSYNLYGPGHYGSNGYSAPTSWWSQQYHQPYAGSPPTYPVAPQYAAQAEYHPAYYGGLGRAASSTVSPFPPTSPKGTPRSQSPHGKWAGRNPHDNSNPSQADVIDSWARCDGLW